MAITHYVNSARHGLSTRWCKNGNKKYEWSYANNMKNGVLTSWYVTGQKAAEAIFTDDLLSGRNTEWWENGQLKSDEYADPGRQTVSSTRWYENGQKQCESTRAKGGPPTKTAWDENGNVLELDEEELIAHCTPADMRRMGALRPGEHIVIVRGTSEKLTKYSTIGDKKTETEIEVSDALREIMASAEKSVKECGLPMGP